MEEWQKEFDLKEQEQQCDVRRELIGEILRADASVIADYARIIGWHALKQLEVPLTEKIREEVGRAVQVAISSERGRKGCEFVDAELKELFKIAMEEFFEPIRDDFSRIANSYRRESDEADWWKGPTEDGEGDE